MLESETEVDEAKEADQREYHQHLNRVVAPILKKFDALLTSYVMFSLVFFGAMALEWLLFLFFFAFLAASSVLAICLAGIFLTAFTYLILRLYLQTRKPEQLCALRDEFIEACKSLVQYQEGIAEHHVAIANAGCRFSSLLHDREYLYHKPPGWLDIFAPMAERFSCWWHWREVYKMRELLLLSSVEEHICLVKCEPTNLEVHATLANAYVLLSSLYADPRKLEDYDDERWIPEERFSESMQSRFRATASRAIEEFKILNDYAPNDPWVHAQLAYSYHDLQMPEEEIKEYETILRLRPDDRETLFKLGMLYFQQGQNAKGLRIYEELKHSQYQKAENLIRFYGTYALG